MDSVENLREVWSQLDAENQSIVTLMIHALARKDGVTFAGLEALAARPRQTDEECDCDLDLVRSARAICPDDEAMAWGRVLALCALRGDAGRMSAVEGLIRRRVAS